MSRILNLLGLAYATSMVFGVRDDDWTLPEVQPVTNDMGPTPDSFYVPRDTERYGDELDNGAAVLALNDYMDVPTTYMDLLGKAFRVGITAEDLTTVSRFEVGMGNRADINRTLVSDFEAAGYDSNVDLFTDQPSLIFY
jgi:hypothetical protein